MEKKANTSSEIILKKSGSNKAVYSITPFTLLDYPDKTACIIWFAGCNMRCLYCYNPDIVLGKGKIDFETVLTFLKSRKGLLDGVVLSGGECSIHKNILDFIKQIKLLGFNVKIDTNGSSPRVLKKMIHEKLIDYAALDFKSLPAAFKTITQSNLFAEFEESLTLLMNSSIPFEVRTTLHSALINRSELAAMRNYLEAQNYEGNYYIQHFVNNVPTIGNLEYSEKSLRFENFSTSKINVIFREQL
ncbi:anaerobic ribonucleoside-triphosphate reductase activating protein [Flavobacterium johnsoniae]|uniref:anaerobic ribonucleoside-triphosphate reductase activating protein n=1 Tax=Flavobacterium johnsoniae TaxID=986 RepID=UPI001F61919B|nr:anaerobic ribonucleoside-triphosphate reductase activating protein [Flavobacterium johnsoniae]